ncbi:uncharacterized protein [Watersipora subatra]|uniref:uncharacterized protein n=1 Tax=Watersipora subatra TaxID=2589382 RepID=UPI00355B9BF8
MHGYQSQGCDCAVIRMTGMSQLAPWSDFTDICSTNKKTHANPYKPARNLYEGQPIKSSPYFKHHTNREDYIHEYKLATQKCTQGGKISCPALASRYNLQFPAEAEMITSVDSAEKCPERCSNSESRAATLNNGSMLSYADFHDYVADIPKEHRLPRRSKIEINLTGKFVKRVQSSRSLPCSNMCSNMGQTMKRHIKLPVPQRPLLTCSYKLPATLKYKSAEKAGPPSGRQKMDPLEKSSTSSTIAANDTSTAVANEKSFSSALNKRAPPPAAQKNAYQRDVRALTSSKVDRNRRKQLRKLIELLGETTLSPYLRTLTLEQSNIAQQIPNAEPTIDDIVFGNGI